ncbi:hypothetical protein CR970_00510 [Candidatus Saccharibacteria bacterium]|nr:MAG: hypothetical protein CR970_00510 [Candidatus Saccharibacteria bacterium]
MILPWLLFTRSLRHNWRYFALVAGAISIGVATLLLFMSGLNALSSRMSNSSLQQTMARAATAPRQEPPNTNPLYVAFSSGSNVDSFWRDKQIKVIRLATEGRNSPQFQDLPTPSVGEYYVSPGLKEIIDKHPEDAVEDRFGEELLGLLPEKYVLSPDELLVVRAMEPSEAKRLDSKGASVLTIYDTRQEPAASRHYPKTVVIAALTVVVIVLLPILLLVSAATRLGANQREQRYAALRLIGASRAQVRQVMMTESFMASAVGIAAGIALYAAAKPLMREFSFNGLRFWPHELAIPSIQILGIAMATLILAAAINWWTIRRVQTSPLAVGRRIATHKQLHWWRLVPLIAGGGLLGFIASPLYGTAQDSQKNAAALLIFTAVLIVALGLVTAGPYVTQKLAMLAARYTKRAETLLSMKYISLHAGSVFRGVSGVVISLFAGSFLLACATGIQSFMEQMVGSNGYSSLRQNSVLVGSYPLSEPLPGKQSAVFRDLDFIRDAAEVQHVGHAVTIAPCRTAAQYTTLTCPADKKYIGINFNQPDTLNKLYGNTEADVREQTLAGNPYLDESDISPSYFLQIERQDIDKLRSFIAKRYMQDGLIKPSLFDGASSNTPFINPIISEIAELSYIGIGVTFFVAVIGLAIATMGSLLERRRSLTTLRLGGATLQSLRTVVILQSLLPLLSAAIASSALGLTAGSVLVTILTNSSPSIVSFSYVLMLGGCIVVATITTLLVLPSIRPISDPEKLRTE